MRSAKGCAILVFQMARFFGVQARFIIEPSLGGEGGWLALRGDLAPEGADLVDLRRQLARRFAGIQVWFSDLDDFDTRSPAKIIALKAVGAGRLSPAYAWWAVSTVALFLRHGRKRGEALSWKLYHDSFLKKEAGQDWLKDEAFDFIDRLLTPEGVAALLYPSVKEFYEAFGADKYLVTRNLERIAYRYSKVLPYAGYFHEARDKVAIVESFIASHPGIRRYGSGGDSEEDVAVAEFLERMYRRGGIERPICLFRAPSPRALNGAFNVFVGKDRSGLASLLAQELRPAPAGDQGTGHLPGNRFISRADNQICASSLTTTPLESSGTSSSSALSSPSSSSSPIG
jgi:hypothetical protein